MRQDVQCKGGKAALHFAAEYGHVGVVAQLCTAPGAAAALAHRGDGCTRRQHRPFEIDFKNLLPLIDWHGLDRTEQFDPGIGDQHIHTAKALGSLFDRALKVRE